MLYAKYTATLPGCIWPDIVSCAVGQTCSCKRVVGALIEASCSRRCDKRKTEQVRHWFHNSRSHISEVQLMTSEVTAVSMADRNSKLSNGMKIVDKIEVFQEITIRKIYRSLLRGTNENMRRVAMLYSVNNAKEKGKK